MPASPSPHPSPPNHGAAAATPDAGAASESKKSFLQKIGPYLWPVVCLFQLAFIVSWASMGKPEEDALSEKAGSTTRPEKKSEKDVNNFNKNNPVHGEAGGGQILDSAPASALTLGEIGRGDDWLREGRYDAALATYRPLSLRSVGSQRQTLQYRVALCLEGLGRSDRAQAAYRKAASRGLAPATAAAQLGQARVFVRMAKPAEAKALLCDLLRRSAQPVLRDGPLLGDARYLLALALALEALPMRKPGPLDVTFSGQSATGWPVERFLDWATAAKEQAPGPARKEHENLAVERFGKAPDAVTVRASIRQSPVLELLDRLAASSKLRTHWTSLAREVVAGRVTSLVVVHLPLADAVRIIADPLGLTYRITDGAIHFAAVKEMPAGDMTSYRASAARRALREALLAFPGHALTPSACLELGNLEGAEGHLLEAAIWYERLIREMPGSANLVEAQFNLALVRDRQGELATARAAYYRVVDLAPAHELAPLAYYQVGRLHLDEADPQRALTPLRRALAVSPGSATEPAAAVALAAVHLLTDNPRVASAVLAEYRQAVARAPFRQTAAFLGALASLRSAGHSSEAKREGADLLTSLLGLGDGPLLGPMGRLLVGQAFHELGMDDPAVESYRKGLAESRGPLAEYLTFTLAESHFSAGTPAAARKLYSGLAAKETSSWNPSSRLRLAEIDLQERKPRDSVARCRKLLEDWKGWKELEIYKVMGQAFTQMGDHRRAAACFAGRVPNG